MTQDKRLLLAFTLSFALVLLWQARFGQRPVPPAKPAATVAKRPAAPLSTPAKTLGPVHLAAVQGTQAEIVVVDADLYSVAFSTRGAVVTSWVLKKYQDEKGLPLDLVNLEACKSLGYPMGLSVADLALRDKLNNALFVVRPGAGTHRAPAKLEFSYSDGKVAVKKQFSFGHGYDLQAEVSVVDGERYLPLEVGWPGGVGDQSLPYPAQEALRQAVFSSQDSLDTVSQKKAREARLIPGPLVFAGLEDRYFAGVFFPGSAGDGFRIGRESWAPPEWKEKDRPDPLVAALVSPEPKPLRFRMFVGPKALDVLRAQNPPLDGLVDFGWFSFVAKPLFLGLRYIYDRWVHNYGWAIVLLTVIINMGLFPLKLKSIRSAQEMQRIAPMVKSIQERYKQYKFNDPRKQRMNQEIMKLYQEHGINPLGGCIPMGLQLPILYGFYRVLELPIELRHAPWILWIRDLSAPDRSHLFGLPLGILPTIMIVSMFVMQKMTPMATADPAQQKMMTIFMPLMFGIMFYNFASGLVLYFLAANLVGIAQQAFINWKLPVSPAVASKTSPVKT